MNQLNGIEKVPEIPRKLVSLGVDGWVLWWYVVWRPGGMVKRWGGGGGDTSAPGGLVGLVCWWDHGGMVVRSGAMVHHCTLVTVARNDSLLLHGRLMETWTHCSPLHCGSTAVH